jgi:ribonuclease HII
MITSGIDEAGRGPVIGPMVMAICAIDENKVHLLDEMGVKDSKLLTKQKREELFIQIQNICTHNIIILSPLEIDAALNDRTVNLNRLEGKTTAALINSVNADKCIIDCPSPNIKAYTEFIKSMVPKKINLICEHKADMNNTIVGAASILAKVTRDRMIEDLQKIAKIDFGSGYPSDPKTVEFLKKNWDKFDFFRKSWSTYKNVAESGKTKQQKLNF